MKKKLIGAIVPLALVAALAGCSTSAPAADAASKPTFSKDHPVTIEFWNTFTGPLEDQLTSLVNDFESSHPGIIVKPVYQPYDSILQSMQTAVAAKKPPAMAQLELTQMAQLASFGALSPISSLIGTKDTATLKKSMIPSIATANSFDGTLYTVPFGYNSNVLYYNTDLITKAGLATSDLPKTWDQLEQVGAKLTTDSNGDGKPDVYGYGFPAQAPWILEPRLWQAGGEVFNTDGTKALFNSAKAVDMVQNYQDLVKDKAGEMVQTDSSLDQLTDLFAAGKIAMFEQSSTAGPTITSKAKFDVGVSQFPTMGKPVFSLGGYNLGTFKGAPADQQAAAAVFEQWWSTPSVAAKWTTISNYMPGIQAAWDTDTLKKWESEDPARKVAADQIPNARSRPNLPSYPEISTDWANAFQATLSGQGTAKSNLDSAVSKANSLLASN